MYLRCSCRGSTVSCRVTEWLSIKGRNASFCVGFGVGFGFRFGVGFGFDIEFDSASFLTLRLISNLI